MTPPTADASSFPMSMDTPKPETGVKMHHAAGRTDEYPQIDVTSQPNGPIERRLVGRDSVSDESSIPGVREGVGFFKWITTTNGIFAALFIVLLFAICAFIVVMHPEWQRQGAAEREKAWTTVKEIQKDALAVIKEVAISIRDTLKEHQSSTQRDIDRIATGNAECQRQFHETTKELISELRSYTIEVRNDARRKDQERKGE